MAEFLATRCEREALARATSSCANSEPRMGTAQSLSVVQGLTLTLSTAALGAVNST